MGLNLLEEVKSEISDIVGNCLGQSDTHDFRTRTTDAIVNSLSKLIFLLPKDLDLGARIEGDDGRHIRFVAYDKSGKYEDWEVSQMINLVLNGKSCNLIEGTETKCQLLNEK